MFEGGDGDAWLLLRLRRCLRSCDVKAKLLPKRTSLLTLIGSAFLGFTKIPSYPLRPDSTEDHTHCASQSRQFSVIAFDHYKTPWLRKAALSRRLSRQYTTIGKL